MELSGVCVCVFANCLGIAPALDVLYDFERNINNDWDGWRGRPRDSVSESENTRILNVIANANVNKRENTR